MLLEVGHPLLQVGGGGHADADGGVDLVGHAGNQGTEGGHFLRLHQGLLGLLEIVIGLAQLVVGIAQAAGAFRHLAFQLLVEQGDLPLDLFEGGDVIAKADQVLEVGPLVEGSEGPLQYQLVALLVVHGDLPVLQSALLGQGGGQLVTLLLADEEIQPVVLQQLLVVIAGEQDGRRVDAGDVEIRLHAADDHVGGVDQGGGEVPLLLELIGGLMAGRELVVQPGAHLVEGGGQGIEFVRGLAGQGATFQGQLHREAIQAQFLGIADDAVDMTDHQIVDDDQDAERDDQGLDGLADQDQHGFLDEALVDLLQGGGDEQLADHFPLIAQGELAGDVVLGLLHPLGEQGHFRIAQHLLDHDELHVGQVHDALDLHLHLLFIQIPETGRDGLQEGGLDLADAGLDDGHILVVVPGELKHGDEQCQHRTADQNVGKQTIRESVKADGLGEDS